MQWAASPPRASCVSGWTPHARCSAELCRFRHCKCPQPHKQARSVHRLHEWLNASCPVQRWLCSFPSLSTVWQQSRPLAPQGRSGPHAGCTRGWAPSCFLQALRCAVLQRLALQSCSKRSHSCKGVAVLCDASCASGCPFQQCSDHDQCISNCSWRAHSSSALERALHVVLVLWVGCGSVACIAESGSASAFAGFGRLFSAASLREQLGADRK